MPKKFPAEVHERAVRMVLDGLTDYPTVFAACSALAPKAAQEPRRPHTYLIT